MYSEICKDTHTPRQICFFAEILRAKRRDIRNLLLSYFTSIFAKQKLALISTEFMTHALMTNVIGPANLKLRTFGNIKNNIALTL